MIPARLGSKKVKNKNLKASWRKTSNTICDRQRKKNY